MLVDFCFCDFRFSILNVKVNTHFVAIQSSLVRSVSLAFLLATPLLLNAATLFTWFLHSFAIFFVVFCDYFVILLLLCWDLLGFRMLWVQLISSACVLSYKIQLGSCAIHFALQRSFEPFLDLRHNQHRRG